MPPAEPTDQPRRRNRIAALPRWARVAGGAALLAVALLLVLATLPVAPFRDAAAHRLSARLHRTVTIARLERLDRFSLAPRIRLSGIRVAQPAWVGGGDMLVVREAVVRVPVLPALFGRLRPSLLGVEGARVALVHDAGVRANWRVDGPTERPDSTAPDLTTILLKDVRFTLLDARRKLRLTGMISSDPQGVRLRASGMQRGTPAQAALTGVPVSGDTAGKPWPFRAAFASPLARLTLDATADRPLDFSHFEGTATADGDNLEHLDDLLLIGLIPTQPLSASAHLRRAGDRWELTQVRARIGRSDLAGTITADRPADRWQIDARIRSNGFVFDDLADAAGLARNAAMRRRTGERVFPDLKINLAKLRTIDGHVEFHAAHLLVPAPSIYRSLDATIVLDHARLTVDPLVWGLTHGRLEGRAVVTQPAARTIPNLAIDLALVGGRLEDFVTTGQITGPLRGRAILGGDGDTLRAAIAHADGSVAMASRGGAVAKTAAEMLGRNLGAAFALMIGGSESRTPLHCFAARFAARGGKLVPTLFTIDTGVMRADGRGTVNLDGETVALGFDGRSKHPGLVRLPAPIEVGGTLSHPTIATRDAGIHSAKLVFKALGQALGRLFQPREAPAPDVDCGALMAKAGV